MASANDLKSYQWKNRILVANGSSPQLAEQKKRFEAQTSENSNRQLLWIEASKDDELFKDMGFQAGQAEVNLVGKDGGVKHRFTGSFEMSSVYELIDAMPMRIEEMKK